MQNPHDLYSIPMMCIFVCKQQFFHKLSLAALVMHFYITIHIILFLVSPIDLFSQKTKNQRATKNISLALEFPKSSYDNIVSADSKDSTFDIRLIIKNNTDTLASFYADWNTWGFYNISFELKTKDTTLLLLRAGGCWDKNFPSSRMLFPGDSLIFSYNIMNCDRQSCDCFLELPKKSLEDAQIRAICELQKENHLPHIENVIKYGEFMLIMGNSHPQKFKKLSLFQKIKSYVTDKLYSEQYTIKFLTDN